MTAFSHTGINNIIQNDTIPQIDSIIYTKIPINAAKELAKDLIKCDSVSADNANLKENGSLLILNNQLLSSNLKLKDSVIANRDTTIEIYKKKDTSYLNIIDLKNIELTKSTDLNKSLAKSLKKEKVKNTFNKIIGSAALAVVGYLALFKK